MTNKTKVLNLFGGPSTGKSSTCAGVFYFLKWSGYNVEMALEYAKDVVWGEEWQKLRNQTYLFAKQYHRLRRLEGKVDLIITDSPLALSLVYGEHETDTFKDLVREKCDEFDMHNIFLYRTKPYSQPGRIQNEDQAKELDITIERMLDLSGLRYSGMDADIETAKIIAENMKGWIDNGSIEE